VGRGDQLSPQCAVYALHSCVLFGRALLVFAPDQYLSGFPGKPLPAQDIGQLYIGRRGESADSGVMFGQPVQALLHIHFAFNAIIAKAEQVQFLHRIPRPRRIIQRANLGVDQFNRDPVPLYIPSEKTVSHSHSRSN
jgi:hypothetical protein